MAKRKREINSELLDVFATIMYEKADAANARAEGLSMEDHKYYQEKGYASGIFAALAMLSCLEEGKFQKEYDAALAKLAAQQTRRMEV